MTDDMFANVLNILEIYIEKYIYVRNTLIVNKICN